MEVIKMGLFGAIGSFIGGVCSAVGSICSSIGGAIMGAVGALAPAIASFLPVLGPVLCVLAQLFAGKPEKEEPEEIGMKAELAGQEGVKPENFDSIGAYLDELRNNPKYQIEPEKLKNLTPEERAKYQLTGLGLYVKDIEEQQGIALSPAFLKTIPAMEKQGYKVEDIAGLMQNMKNNGVSDMGKCADYLRGDLQPGSEDMSKVYHSVKDMVEKHFADGAIDTDEKIDDLKAAVKSNL